MAARIKELMMVMHSGDPDRFFACKDRLGPKRGSAFARGGNHALARDVTKNFFDYAPLSLRPIVGLKPIPADASLVSCVYTVLTEKRRRRYVSC